LFRQFALPPGGRPILSYLRLGDLGETESPDLEAHWRRLEETIPPDRGLFERLRRCCLLPCTLPEQAREAVRALVPEEAIPLLKRLRVTLHGTIGRLHLLDISLTLIDVFPEALEPAQAQVVNRLSDAGETEVRLLASLADLSWRALDNAREEDDQTTTAQLSFCSARLLLLSCGRVLQRHANASFRRAGPIRERRDRTKLLGASREDSESKHNVTES
jgi:hypothetical protein